MEVKEIKEAYMNEVLVPPERLPGAELFGGLVMELPDAGNVGLPKIGTLGLVSTLKPKV